MNEETKSAAKDTAPTTAITTIITALLAGNVGGIGDSLHTLITNALGEHRTATYILIGVCVILIRAANALYQAYPDRATRPRWAQWLISFFPTTPPPKEA